MLLPPRRVQRIRSGDLRTGHSSRRISCSRSDPSRRRGPRFWTERSLAIPNILITGGAKRIGADLARRFAGAGFKVAIHYGSSEGEAEALRDELTASRSICSIHRADLRDRSETERMFDEVRATMGAVDLCINNASMFVNDDLLDYEDTQFDDHLGVNLKAPVQLGALMRRQPEEAEDRLILNMLDNKVFAINPDFFTYTLSKTALLAATRMMAMRFAGFPRVCGIAPSITLISGKQSPENFEKSSRINYLGRRVFPSDIADAALFLWKTKSCNDQIITIDGGQSMMRLSRDVAFLTKEGHFDE
ncbi:SDR family oxidoreductase [Rhodovulum visakhapatnamense]|uniref:SDR family oxidoreductase n=1 Tax=Rhodovulum visakhapatnamense TaxID=364297 RepID=A0ABS1RDI2_9RHOB|nr:SDR family oxidoreductase [Rhodovulum visakhapatnamense]MBL3577691.1 SDR family oxidoreductase [Rhodovulum visakhapatnamense]